MNIPNRIAGYKEDLVKIRRDLHRHPELGFEEHRTSKFVQDALASYGVEFETGIAETGVVGILKVGDGDEAIGLRADMDALPIHEMNDFDHRSTVDGKMHACGHDGHTTMLLGAARYLAETKNFSGCVYFIFQPAEEGLGGAKAMVSEGLLERFPMQAIFGLHNRPSAPEGQVLVRPGAMMAGGVFFDITVTGKGTHGGRPEAGIDPILTASHITVALQAIVSRNVKATEPLVISVTQIHAGDAYNVVPESAVIRGTIRAFTKEGLRYAETRIRDVSENVAQAYGATVNCNFEEVFLPLHNDAQATEFAADTAAEIVGNENVDRNGPMHSSSEDFSYMLDKCPGAYVYIGAGKGGTFHEVHSANYDFNDDILTLGASYLAKLVERRLPQDTT